jgi:hypothetical protein
MTSTITYTFPVNFAEGESVRDQILEEILMGDGLAAATEHDLAIGRWDAACGFPAGYPNAQAASWLHKNGPVKQLYRPASQGDPGQVAEPDHFEQIRKWAIWETQVLTRFREEFILKRHWEECFPLPTNPPTKKGNRIGWTRITTNLHNKVKTQEQQIDVLQKQSTISEQSNYELQNHAIVQQQQIDELRSVVDALARQILHRNHSGYIKSYVEKINYEDECLATEEAARLAKIAAFEAIKKEATEKVATEKAANKKSADDKASTLAKMTDRVNVFKEKQAKRAKAREEEDKKENVIFEAMTLQLDQYSFEHSSDEQLNDSKKIVADLPNSAVAAELRAEKALVRGTQRGKNLVLIGSDDLFGVDSWSDNKCDIMSKGWCE